MIPRPALAEEGIVNVVATLFLFGPTSFRGMKLKPWVQAWSEWVS